MSGTYKITEIVGTSSKSFADAVQEGVKRASKTIRNMSWFEVSEMRGKIAEGKVDEFQVTVKIGFKLEA
jgi:dodecin